ncbi:hypothetical protein D1007_30418 [Hordeum vulgare]|nr:hypothetical protein D1007_30418 [Hordeum vulgare]
MHHAIQGFSGAETWEEFKKTLLRSRLIQKGYDNPNEKTCACKICGEIGHTQEEHTDGCTHCEENHPAEECPSSQVTCFLCEGTTHYPAQCHIYPKVQQVVKQQKDAVKETLKKKILEEPVMNEYIEDPDGQAGLFLGTVTGGLIGWPRRAASSAGTRIGAITEALVSIEVVDSSIRLWRSRRSGIWSILRHAPSAAVVDASTPFPSVVEDEKVRGGARGPGR